MMDSVETAEVVDDDKATDGSAPATGNSNIQDAVANALRNVDWSVVPLSGTESSGSGAAQSGHVKKPMNAFMLWAQVARPKLSHEHPKLLNPELSKILGILWKQLSEDDKKPFFEESRRIRSQHHIDHPGYKYESKRKALAQTNQSSAKASGPVNVSSFMLPSHLPNQANINWTNHNQSIGSFNPFEFKQTTQEKKAPRGREFKGRFSQWHSGGKPANRGHTRFVDKWNSGQENVEMDFSNFLQDHSKDNSLSNAGNAESIIAMAFNQACGSDLDLNLDFNLDMDLNQAEFTDDTNIATDSISTQMFLANQNQAHASTANQNLDDEITDILLDLSFETDPQSNKAANSASNGMAIPGSVIMTNPGSAGMINPGSAGLTNPGSAGATNPGLSEVANPGSAGVNNPGSAGLTNPGSAGLANPWSAGVTNPGLSEVANLGSAGVNNPGSAGLTNPGSAGLTNPESAGLINPGSAGLTNLEPAGAANLKPTGVVNLGSAIGVANPGGVRVANIGSVGVANRGSFGMASSGSVREVNPGSFGGTNPGGVRVANPGLFGGTNLGSVAQSFLIAIQQVLESCRFQNFNVTNQKMTEVLARTLDMQTSFTKLTPAQNLANIGTFKHGANSAVAGNQTGIQIPSYSDFRPGNPIDQGQMNKYCMMGAPNDATHHQFMDLPANIKTSIVAPPAIPKTGCDIDIMQTPIKNGEVEAKNVPESDFKATN